jgi:hypothetical protein
VARDVRPTRRLYSFASSSNRFFVNGRLFRRSIAQFVRIPLEGFMRSLVIPLVAALALPGCWPEQEVTGSTNKCAADMFPQYNPKVLKQCVDVCIKCDHGVMTTCSTSCNLKGAR